MADPYDLLDLYSLPSEDVEELRRASAALSCVYRGVAVLLQKAPDETLLDLGIPDYLLKVVRCAVPESPAFIVGRFDFAHTSDGYKMLELNADVPGFFVEAFDVNGEICKEAGRADPNHGCRDFLARYLTAAVEAAAACADKSTFENLHVVITSRDYPRDRGEAIFVSKLLHRVKAQWAPVTDLSIDKEGLYDANGRRIDVLYRFLPMRFFGDHLFSNRDNIGNPQMGGLFVQHIEHGRLAVINPPVASLLESKAVQALIWNLFETGQYFSEEDSTTIRKYMLPTYLDIPGEKSTYVMKPMFGGEGESITLVRDEGMTKSDRSTYTDHPMVYQKYVPLPKKRFITEYGPRDLHLAISCFVLAETPSAICMRAGDIITDESAWVVPLCMAG